MRPTARTAILLAATLCLLLQPAHAGGLKDYVLRSDDSYTYKLYSAERVGDTTICVVDMISQTWQGIPWQHWVSIIVPGNVTYPKTALLIIYGSRNNEKPPAFDSEEALALVDVANQTGSVVAVVSQVPNGPLFGGMTEDTIVAYTYKKFLEGAGDDWPLQKPMVKSAVRAMDTVQAMVKANFGHEIKKFVLTGTSKRGWAAWLTAAADKRVAGVAPMAFDALNMRAQMEHQVKSYGGFSEKMDEYDGMQAHLNTPQGQRLLDMIDPYAYRKQLDLPKLIVTGTNDPYWTADAARFYFDDLSGAKYIHYEPNKGHDLGLTIVPEVTAFFHALAAEHDLPQLGWRLANGTFTVTWDDARGKAVLWQAKSTTRDFREARWSSKRLSGVKEVSTPAPSTAKGWLAYYVAVTFPMVIGETTVEYSLCTPITIVPDLY